MGKFFNCNNSFPEGGGACWANVIGPRDFSLGLRIFYNFAQKIDEYINRTLRMPLPDFIPSPLLSSAALPPLLSIPPIERKLGPMDLEYCRLPELDLWLLKNSDRGPRYMLLAEAIRYLKEGQIPLHLMWTEDDIIRSWNSVILLPRGHDNRYLFNHAELEVFKQEFKSVAPDSGQLPFRFGPLIVPLEVPLDTCRKFQVSNDEAFRHLMVGMPGTRETHIYIKSRASSASPQSSHTVLFLPYRFHYARKLLPDPRPSFQIWSNEKAKESLGLDSSAFFPLKVLVWNCKGAGAVMFDSTVSDLVNSYDPTILVILETRLPKSKGKDLKEILPFDSCSGIDSVGLSGGVWLLWNKGRVSVVAKGCGTDFLNVIVRENP